MFRHEARSQLLKTVGISVMTGVTARVKLMTLSECLAYKRRLDPRFGGGFGLNTIFNTCKGKELSLKKRKKKR